MDVVIMNDLTTGIIILAAACMVSLIAGFQTGGLRRRKTFQRVQAAVVAMMAAYMTFLWNRPVLASLLPTSNVIILANWLPIWGCFFVGCYVRSPRIAIYRRVFIAAVSLCICGYSAVAPVLGTSPECSSVGYRGHELQYQSTPYTCSAACAVSLLQMHGIEATEDELAELCLTRKGTHWMGLFRGLKLKTKGTAWDVVAEPLDLTGLSHHRLSPCVLSVRVNVNAFPAGVDHGFRDDVGHSVVFLGSSSQGQITVFDPSPDFGIEQWDHGMLRCIDGGVCVRLVPRDPEAPEVIGVGRNLALTMLNSQLLARR